MELKFPTQIRGLIDKSMEGKRPDQKVWDISLMFLEGRQWLDFDRRVDRFVESRGSSAGYKVTINLLLNVYRNVLARLALAYPSCVVLPASPSYDDIIKAKSSEAALKYFWQSQRVKDTLTEALEWLLTTGTVALHPYYDPGDKNVKLEAFGAYDIFFEKGVRSPDDSSWVALRSYHTRHDLKEAYPDKTELIDSTPVSSQPNNSGAAPIDSGTMPPDRIEVYEFYWRDGRHGIGTESGWLYTDKHTSDGFPVEIIRYSVIPRRLWGLSLIAPLLDIQLYYNKSRSQLMHNVELMGNPKWLVPKTSGVSNSAITSRPGEKIYYNPAGGAPQQIAPAPIPEYVIHNMTRLQSEMGDVAGLHSVSLGKRAVGVTSGKAMETLAAYDTSQLEGTQYYIEQAVAAMAKSALMLMQKYYTEEKMIRMLDDSGRVTFNAIHSTNLSEDPEVFIEAGSLFRDEAQDRDAKVMELLQLGLIPPGEALNELSFRTGNSFVSKKVSALAHAKDMLEAAKLGGEIEMFKSDDLEAFAEVFSEYIQGSEFYTLDDETQDYIRGVLVAIESAYLPDEAYAQMLATQEVFPRNIAPPQGPPPGLAMPGMPGMQDGSPLPGMAPTAQPGGSFSEAEVIESGRGEALLAGRGGL
tara:strand:- start:3408 stop:5321 length:1914 start_codon:yes stop_codon:yes gene_type:complete